MNKGYRSELNSDMTWNYIGTETGQTAVAIPNNAKEVYIFITNGRISSSVYADCCVTTLLVDTLDASIPSQIVLNTSQGTTDASLKITIRATKTSVHVQQSSYSGSGGDVDCLSTTSMKVYYR